MVVPLTRWGIDCGCGINGGALAPRLRVMLRVAYVHVHSHQSFSFSLLIVTLHSFDASFFLGKRG
jgi:hypothetical protein